MQRVESDKLIINLRKIRRHKNITLERIARGTGLSVSHLSRIENSKMNPTLDTFLMYVNAIGCRMEIWEI